MEKGEGCVGAPLYIRLDTGPEKQTDGGLNRPAKIGCVTRLTTLTPALTACIYTLLKSPRRPICQVASITEGYLEAYASSGARSLKCPLFLLRVPYIPFRRVRDGGGQRRRTK